MVVKTKSRVTMKLTRMCTAIMRISRKQSKNSKNFLKKITTVLKKEIVGKHERAIHVTDLASEYKMAGWTISINLKNKDAIQGADVAQGRTLLTKQRT